MRTALVALMLALAVAMALLARMTGPSDLHARDQVRTVAYTGDVVINGRWALPRDLRGRPATKPPMYNWIGALAVYATGRWDEWVLRFPAILSGLGMVTAVVVIGAQLARLDPLNPGDAWGIGLASGVCLTGSHMGVREIYEARPNGLLSAFLVAAWASAVVLMTGKAVDRRPVGRFLLALALWLCVSGAALSKGPAALVIVIYIPLAAWLIHRDRSALWRTGIPWGLPLAFLITAAWLYTVWRQAPTHLLDTLIGDEILDRVSGEMESTTFLGQVLAAWKVPGYFVTRFLPWSALAIIALVHLRPRRWLTHPTAHAILWVLVVLGFFGLFGNKRADYLFPALGPAAIVATYWMVRDQRRVRLTSLHVAAIAMVFVCVFAAVARFQPRFGRDGAGDNVIDFAHEASGIVGDDPVIFLDNGYHALQVLMGRHQGQFPPSPQQVALARWVIVAEGVDRKFDLQRAIEPEPVLTSRPLPGFRGGRQLPVRLHRLND